MGRNPLMGSLDVDPCPRNLDLDANENGEIGEIASLPAHLSGERSNSGSCAHGTPSYHQPEVILERLEIAFKE